MGKCKLMVLYLHPNSPEKFQEHYMNVHLPLAAQLPGLLASRYTIEPIGVNEPSPYFCIWEGDFVDMAAIDIALYSEIGQSVAADAGKLATGGIILLRCQAVEISD